MPDLFEPRLPVSRLHDGFRHILTAESYAKVRSVIQSWSTGLLEIKGESDKFVKEFQTTFNSSMWELYLNRLFVSMNFSIDRRKESPDFCIAAPDGREFNVEAVISDQPRKLGLGMSPVGEDFKVTSALKIIGKIRDKLHLFKGTGGKRYPYSSLGHVKGRPFVVAIAPFDSDQSLTQNNELINLVLFGIGAPEVQGSNLGVQGRVRSLTKTSGASVDVGIFTNDSFKEISAIIFSTVGTLGKAVVESKAERIIRSTRYRVIDKQDIQYRSSIFSRLGIHRAKLSGLNYLVEQRWDFGAEVAGSDVRIQHSSLYTESHSDGLHIYYNPYAEIPLNLGDAWPREVTHNYYDVKNNEPIHIHPDRALVSRQVFALNQVFLHTLLKGYGFVE